MGYSSFEIMERLWGTSQKEGPKIFKGDADMVDKLSVLGEDVSPELRAQIVQRVAEMLEANLLEKHGEIAPGRLSIKK